MVALMREDGAEKLTELLISRYHMKAVKELDEYKDPQMMLQAYIKVAEREPVVVRKN